MHILLSWFILTLAVWGSATLLPGVSLRGLRGAVLVAAIFGILNWSIGYVLFVLIGIGTLGIGFLLAFLTRWIVDALLLKMTAGLTDKLQIKSFGWAMLAAMFMSAIGTFAQYILV